MVENTPDSGTASEIRGVLAGKQILVTGVTGFLGTALFERLLAEVADARVDVLIRSREGVSAEGRLREVLERSAFDALRSRIGASGLREEVARRVGVVEGDVTSGVDAFPGSVDVVFHCAAAVSFDPPVDEAFLTNVAGAARLYETIAAAGARPHVVHMSTAYVAGSTKGVVREASLRHDVDWRVETDAALAARSAVEAASRRPEMLDAFLAKARARHSRAGPQAVAADAEWRRREWVRRRLVQYGRARAQSLGWPDVYTFSKALGERAAEEITMRHGLPLSVVRPSIIESALERPHPGWIEGFKMAEPVILAFGRGAMPEFPGHPDVVVDIIPVDLVVSAMLAVAARRPPDEPAYYHVSSGSRNPLSFRRLYELVREHFDEHPLPERGRGAIEPPRWAFPGPRAVEQRLRTAERVIDAADRVVSKLPRSDRVRRAVRGLDRQRARVEFVRRYADLYGPYASLEVIYTDERALALHRSLSEVDRRDFGFDARVVDWPRYLKEIHCPAVTVALRFPSPARPEPAVRIRPSENGTLAVFDMEGTLLNSNVVESYLWLRLAELRTDELPFEIAALARRVPRYLRAERRDRGEFLRAMYRRYAGASVAGVERLVDECVAELLLQRLSAAAVRRIRQHHAAGHRTVLITGALECFTKPLAPLFDEVVAVRLAERDGRYTGDLATPPIVGEARSGWLRRYADAIGADRSRSYAYADSHSDLPLLETVGNPVAVNPDVALFRLARKRRWPVEDWRSARGTPRVLLPERVG